MAPDRGPSSSSSPPRGRRNNNHTYLVYATATVLRLFLFGAFPGASALLEGRVEVASCVCGFKGLKEGLFLYTHNVSPYDGGVFHQAPLLLALFSLIPIPHFHLITALLYITLDLLAAHALVQIAESRQAERTRLFKSPRTGEGWDSWVIAAAYLFNPLIIATCIGRPTSVFTSVSVLWSVANAVGNKPMSAMMGLGVATYLSMYPVLLVGPMVLLGYDRQEEEKARTGTSGQREKAEAAERSEEASSSIWLFAAKNTAIFLAGLAWLLYISYILTGGSWEFISSTYGVQLLVRDLTPNVGLWWYFFIEMFDSFREFFLGVFWLHLAGYVGGLCIRLRKQPLFVVVTMMGIFAIFKPYPTIEDSGLWLSMLPLYRHVFGLMRYTFFAVSALLYACLLGPAFYHLWVYAGSGNANFFYAITLVWSLGLVLILADSLFAVLRDEWEVERPEMRGKEIRQV